MKQALDIFAMVDITLVVIVHPKALLARSEKQDLSQLTAPSLHNPSKESGGSCQQEAIILSLACQLVISHPRPDVAPEGDLQVR